MKKANLPLFGHTALLCVLSLFTLSLTSRAQPSGGPYGPQEVTYSIPDVAGTIFFVAPDGLSDLKGEDPEHPTRLESAIERAKTGDVIILRGGIYRTGNLRFNQGITLQPFADEKPVLKGTYEAKEWNNLGDSLWSTSWKHLFPAQPENWWRRDRNEKFTPLHRFNDDMVFVEGKFLQSAGNTSEVDTHTFFIDYEKEEVYIGTDPSDKLVEITAFNVAIHRVYKDYKGVPSDGIGPVIRGIKFTQYADTAILIEGTYPEGPTDEADYGNDVVGTVLENCEISWCSRIGAYLMGDSLIVRNCKVSNTSTEGIYLVGASDALIEKTIISQNNIEHLTGYFPAAVKIFNQCYRVTCKDNWVTDQPNSNGIWYDVGNVDGVFINNWIENVGNAQAEKYTVFQYMSGFFFEISKGAVVVGNVFLNCDNGSFVLNSSDVEFYQNTYINSKAAFGRTERSAANDHFGWHPATGPDVDERVGHIFMNNLMVQDEKVAGPLLEVWQSPPLCETLSSLQFNRLDHNVYVLQAEKLDNTLIIWSSVGKENCRAELKSPIELNNMQKEFAGNSLFLDNYTGPLFRDPGQNDYHLNYSFPGLKVTAPLPDKIKMLLNQRSDKNRTGAY